MRSYIAIALLFLVFTSCQKHKNQVFSSANEVAFANHLCIQKIDAGFLVEVKQPWPGNDESYRWVLHRKEAKIHDSLQSLPKIQIPIQKIVVTSTTHVPPLELLNKVNTLVGFPNTNYISSETTRKRINSGEIKDLGGGAQMNVEMLMSLKPDVVMSFGVDKEHNSHKILEKLNIITLYNADWVEHSPLGRAEWMLLFGCLFDEFEESKAAFCQIKKAYINNRNIAALNAKKPKVISGAPYEGKWYVPQGNSWAAQLIADAGGDYIWKANQGFGSEVLSVEEVLVSAQHAEFWIAPGQFTSYEQLFKSDPKIKVIQAVKDKKVYTFSLKRGEKGGVIYYEEASSRPDKVLEDMIKILHPNTLPRTELHYFESIK